MTSYKVKNVQNHTVQGIHKCMVPWTPEVHSECSCQSGSLNSEDELNDLNEPNEPPESIELNKSNEPNEWNEPN